VAGRSNKEIAAPLGIGEQTVKAHVQMYKSPSDRNNSVHPKSLIDVESPDSLAGDQVMLR
jgi:FixJ family two-component response regulator